MHIIIMTILTIHIAVQTSSPSFSRTPIIWREAGGRGCKWRAQLQPSGTLRCWWEEMLSWVSDASLANKSQLQVPEKSGSLWFPP